MSRNYTVCLKMRGLNVIIFYYQIERRNTVKKSLIILFLIIFVLSLAGCSSSESDMQEPEFGIAATVFPAYDFARQIAGDRLPVSLVVPAGSDIHSFEPTAKDIIKMENWLVVCNGGESESWVEQIFESSDTKLQPIYMMDCVDVVEEELKEGMVEVPHSHDGEECTEDHEHEEEEEHEHEPEFDEHVWTSPVNAVKICTEICRRLCEIDPEGAEYYKANLADYSAKLMELDGQFRHVVENASSNTLVFADRFPVRYFVEEYDLDYYAAYPGCISQSEPSVRTVVFLIDRVREYKTPAVMYIEFSNEKMADIICEDTGCKKLLFHSCHNVSAKEFEEGITYMELMRSNLESLKEALG